MEHRTELQREIAEALISTKAINFEAIGSIIAKYGARAAANGDRIGVILGHHVIDACIPPYFNVINSLPELEQVREEVG